MKLKNKLLTMFLGFAMLITLMPAVVFAAGRIETDREVAFNISYKDGETPIPNAVFDIYRCADVDEYGQLTVAESFASYPINFKDMDQDGWQSLAVTLKGYAQRDSLPAAASDKTDSEGNLTVALKPGLYLVTGRPLSVDYYTYTATPYMIFLPGTNNEENEWDYEVESYPKFSKQEDVVSRKALKIWDDKGYETMRPKEVVVQLLKNGELSDTKTLNADNDWRCTWEDLSARYEWTVVEKELDGYYTTVSQEGITFTVTNTYIAPIVAEDPPVAKRITGDTPSTAEKFTFVLTGESADCPMPEGSSGTIKEITITGTGSTEFGTITFTKAGTYDYTISEKNTGAEGYTYDSTVYSIHYVVSETDGKLSSEYTITGKDGEKANAAVFTNTYRKPGNKLPQTGMKWWPVAGLICAGVIFFVIGFVWKKKSRKNG